MSDHKPFDNDEYWESVRQAQRDLQTWHEPHPMSPEFDTTKNEKETDDDD